MPHLSRVSGGDYRGAIAAQFRAAPDHARTPDHAGGFSARAPDHAEGRQVVVTPWYRRDWSNGGISTYVDPDISERPGIR